MKAGQRDENLEQARSYQLRLESILDNIVDGLITIDESGIIQSFNKACERIFGYTAAETLGKNINMLMPEPHAASHDGYLKHYRDTGEAKIIGIGRELEAKRKDGTIFPIDLSVAEVKIGEQRLFSGIIRDITERKMQDEQLRHAQKMEAVGQLTSGVAHDFNNLLTVVLGNTRLIRKRLKMEAPQPVFGDIAERIDDIDTAAQRGAELVRRLMVFTRQRPLQKTVVDINVCITETSGLLVRVLGEEIDNKVLLGENIGPVHIDQDQFVNALINMAANARDAMPRGGTLTIETDNAILDEDYAERHPGVMPGNYVLVAISDTGVGMPAEVRERIFEPFFTTKPAGEGTGLGLSMVYGMVQQSGGHIQVYSETGHGTVFKVYLPCHDAAEDTSDDDASLPGGAETILVVEDDDAARILATGVLAELGYKTLLAQDGPTALRILKDTSTGIDLVFADVVLKQGLHGKEVVRVARELRPGIRVLLTSGYRLNALPQGEQPAGENFISKPYRKAELARKIRQVLDATGGA